MAATPKTRRRKSVAESPYKSKIFNQYRPSADKCKVIAERFVLDYNPTPALLQVYSDTVVRSHGHVIIQHPDIQAEVRALQAAARERAIIDESYVIAGLHEVAEKSLGHVPVYRIDEDGQTQAQLQFNGPAATKALETIGRHFGMFKDVLEVSEQVSVEDWVKCANEEYEARHAKPASH